MPIILFRQLVIGKISLEIRAGDKAGNLSRISINQRFKLPDIVPVHIKVIRNLLRCNAGIPRKLRPWRYTVIPLIYEYRFVPACSGTRDHERKARDIPAIFSEKCPVGTMYGIHQQLGELNHFHRR
ncbi:hypothetical protein D3C73_1398910 [compost metagenome]